MIPLIDLKAQYLSIKKEIDNAISDCIDESSFIKGKRVTDFENQFADYIGSKYCLGCANGTDALEIILHSLGVGPGDEVIVPALSWIATAECVSNTGAEPVFVDVDPQNYTIDVSRIEEKISSNTRAIIPVHLYGNPVEMKSLILIAEKHNLYIVEDCAQAHGAEYEGRKTGTFGIASAFSFFPSKNLGAFGDAGAIVTNDKNLIEKARMISNHGQLNVKHHHHIIGRNSRLDTIQASILSVKLRYLDEWNLKRIAIAERYMQGLKSIPQLSLPVNDPIKKHVYHLYVVRSSVRSSIIENLERNQIAYGIHYPVALPFLEAYKYKKHSHGDFPVAGRLTEEIISLPVYPEISLESIDGICKVVTESILK
jgi:dTDP-4-amino-4,6-dideoxygalactose transaminase